MASFLCVKCEIPTGEEPASVASLIGRDGTFSGDLYFATDVEGAYAAVGMAPADLNGHCVFARNGCNHNFGGAPVPLGEICVLASEAGVYFTLLGVIYE
jgi:hypothetical protein